MDCRATLRPAQKPCLDGPGLAPARAAPTCLAQKIRVAPCPAVSRREIPCHRFLTVPRRARPGNVWHRLGGRRLAMPHHPRRTKISPPSEVTRRSETPSRAPRNIRAPTNPASTEMDCLAIPRPAKNPSRAMPAPCLAPERTAPHPPNRHAIKTLPLTAELVPNRPAQHRPAQKSKPCFAPESTELPGSATPSEYPRRELVQARRCLRRLT